MSHRRILSAVDAALVVEFDEVIDPVVNARVVALAGRPRERAAAGVIDVVATFRAVTLYIDPLVADVDALSALVQELAALPDDAPGQAEAAIVDIPVCYGGSFGPDLDDVARATGLDTADVIAAHTSREYRVFMLGFLPGFAYLGSVDPRIAVPRHTTPRLHVPAGSVGLAGEQTGVYPSESPGGWSLIGRTPMRMVDVLRSQPALLQPGDRVRFHAVNRLEFERLLAAGQGA